MSKRYGLTRALAALAAAGALTAATAACELDVKNPGAILEEDLNTPEMMRVLATGASAELSDAVDAMDFTVDRLSDELVPSGSYGSSADLRRGILDEGDTGGEWAQTHEAAWAAGEAIERIYEVMPNSAELPELVSRMHVIRGVAFTMLGENFCQVSFADDEGIVQGAMPRDSAFQRAVDAFQSAISVAGSDTEAQQYRTAAYGGLAAAYLGLEMWAEAEAAAANVPTGFVEYSYFDLQDNDLETWFETHQRPEMSAWLTVADLVSDDSAVDPNDYYDPLLDTGPGQDPRAPFLVCGVYDPVADAVVDQGIGACGGNFQGASGDKSPHYQQMKYPDGGADRPIVSGTEARIIEAEARLVAGDLAGFRTKINEIRTFYGLDLLPVGVPATAGDLRNADEMDAWSILDRERWLTLWLQSKRLWDLWRWDHPFIEGQTLSPKYTPENPRASCMPIPESECDRNPNITC